MESEGDLPEPETFTWATLVNLKCDIKQMVLAYAEKVTDNLLKGYYD